ncbi:Fur family transcriptional regulator [Methyloferula stellata]|uniref:Fur family transcriptional regulator n=1 Tax=Methyloferula stellata TaxID=876270 RepID=UPI00037EFA58|nr:Fur family transcriptional regulator [Methyloferula stellata]
MISKARDEVHPGKAWVKKVEELCARKSLQFTPLRREVVSILAELGKPVGAYEIMDHLAKLKGRTIAPPTVYRTLDFLVENGFVVKIESRQAYIACDDPGHDHHGILLICSGCGRSTEIDNVEVDKILIETASASHFHLQRQVVEVEGLCQSCSEAAAAQA